MYRQHFGYGIVAKKFSKSLIPGAGLELTRRAVRRLEFQSLRDIPTVANDYVTQQAVRLGSITNIDEIPSEYHLEKDDCICLSRNGSLHAGVRREARIDHIRNQIICRRRGVYVGYRYGPKMSQFTTNASSLSSSLAKG